MNQYQKYLFGTIHVNLFYEPLPHPQQFWASNNVYTMHNPKKLIICTFVNKDDV